MDAQQLFKTFKLFEKYVFISISVLINITIMQIHIITNLVKHKNMHCITYVSQRSQIKLLLTLVFVE